MNLSHQFLPLNSRGLIPAPHESEAHFFHRCSNLSTNSSTLCYQSAKALYDIEPDWVEITFASKGLRFWEGGCTWIGEEGVTLQLKPPFQKRVSYLGYKRDEVIAHELVHVVRSHFEEPIFEEILAYQTSTFPFRRYCAPFFRTSGEATLFVCALMVALGASLFETLQLGAFIAFFCLVAGGFLRLMRAQCTFARTKKSLSTLVGEEKALAVMLRLSDKEIISYAKTRATTELRWKLITTAYFNCSVPSSSDLII